MNCLITLVSSILQDPHNANARADLDLIDMVIQFLSKIDNKFKKQKIGQLLVICLEFQRIAKTVMERSDIRASSREKDGLQRGSDLEPHFLSRPTASSTLPAAVAQAPTDLFSIDRNQVNGRLEQTVPNVYSGPAFDIGEISQDFGIPSENMLPFNNGTQQMRDVIRNGDFGPPVNFNSLQQAFIPQDLWNMPMSMDWYSTDTAGSGYTGGDFAGTMNDGTQR